MDNVGLMNYWIESAEDDFESMLVLYEKKRFTHSLFFGHLMIERLLKGLFAKQNPEQPHAPKSHNLLFLAKKCNLEMDNNKENILDHITKFNTEARYEDEKREFHRQCTKDFTTSQIEIIKEIQKWLKEKLTQP